MQRFQFLGEPNFTKAFHKWATIVWFVVSFPLAYLFGSSVIFVTFLSLYAVVTGHWSSYQATRVEALQVEQMDVENVEKMDVDIEQG